MSPWDETILDGDGGYLFFREEQQYMCGIVGYVGAQQAAPILLDGLRRLEYRGYASAGMAVCGPEGLRVCKAGYPRREKFFISVNSASAQP